jgi:hypothetical protein
MRYSSWHSRRTMINADDGRLREFWKSRDCIARLVFGDYDGGFAKDVSEFSGFWF